jgi:O-antigen chain-terminating methyltransferase
VKQLIKKSIKRAAPQLTISIRRLQQVEEKLNALDGKIDGLRDSLRHDSRLDILKEQAKKVEPYQPTYAVTGIFEQTSRIGEDRARVIEQYLGKPAGLRILDIGSSLGYMCYYFADRGARAEGWEARVENAEVSRLIGDINGIPIDIKTKLFDDKTVETIRTGQYDAVFILSVLHHIIYYNGLEYTQKLMKELLQRTPLVIVELAKKGEDRKLFWDKAQPKDELAIFDLIKDDIVIEKLAEFPNHLSKKTRPLYAIRAKQQIEVNNHKYRYDHKTHQAYTQSPMVYSPLVRRYYMGQDFIVKEYSLAQDVLDNENHSQIIAEINNLLQLKNIYGMPKLIEYEITPNEVRVVLERIPGRLLVDKLGSLTMADTIRVATQVLRTLRDLQKEHVHHNDVRTWNVIIGEKTVSLIDYGLVGTKKTDDDAVSLLWMIHAVITGERENYEQFKALPPVQVFKKSEKLTKLYNAIKEGERSAATLLKLL